MGYESSLKAFLLIHFKDEIDGSIELLKMPEEILVEIINGISYANVQVWDHALGDSPANCSIFNNELKVPVDWLPYVGTGKQFKDIKTDKGYLIEESKKILSGIISGRFDYLFCSTDFNRLRLNYKNYEIVYGFNDNVTGKDGKLFWFSIVKDGRKIGRIDKFISSEDLSRNTSNIEIENAKKVYLEDIEKAKKIINQIN